MLHTVVLLRINLTLTLEHVLELQWSTTQSVITRLLVLEHLKNNSNLIGGDGDGLTKW